MRAPLYTPSSQSAFLGRFFARISHFEDLLFLDNYNISCQDRQMFSVTGLYS